MDDRYAAAKGLHNRISLVKRELRDILDKIQEMIDTSEESAERIKLVAAYNLLDRGLSDIEKASKRINRVAELWRDFP